MRPRQWWQHRRARSGTPRELSCREVGRVLQSFLDGEIDDLTRRRVSHHLEDCRRCGLEAQTYTAIKASLAKATPDVAHEQLARLRAFADELASDPPDDESPSA